MQILLVLFCQEQLVAAGASVCIRPTSPETHGSPGTVDRQNNSDSLVVTARNTIPRTQPRVTFILIHRSLFNLFALAFPSNWLTGAEEVYSTALVEPSTPRTIATLLLPARCHTAAAMAVARGTSTCPRLRRTLPLTSERRRV